MGLAVGYYGLIAGDPFLFIHAQEFTGWSEGLIWIEAQHPINIPCPRDMTTPFRPYIHTPVFRRAPRIHNDDRGVFVVIPYPFRCGYAVRSLRTMICLRFGCH